MSNQTTHHAEAILRAAGSSLRHYEARTREAILAAVREAVEAERKAVVAHLKHMSESAWEAAVRSERGGVERAFSEGESMGLENGYEAIEACEHLPTPPRGE